MLLYLHSWGVGIVDVKATCSSTQFFDDVFELSPNRNIFSVGHTRHFHILQGLGRSRVLQNEHAFKKNTVDVGRRIETLQGPIIDTKAPHTHVPGYGWDHNRSRHFQQSRPSGEASIKPAKRFDINGVIGDASGHCSTFTMIYTNANRSPVDDVYASGTI